MRVGWLVLLFACGDNKLLESPKPDDASPSDVPAVDPDAANDAPTTPLLPDLSLVVGQMTNSVLIMNETFGLDACELVEQCIGAAGTRRLLRFDTVTQNLGSADLVVSVPPAMGTTVPPFTWSSCHGHHHFSDYASYDLLDGDNVVVSGHKQAFCILDTMRVTPGAPSQGYNCVNQGMSKGWADVYSRGLPCQWIDITGIPAGTYTLRVRINPAGALIESDYTNNEFTRSITL